ncbi:DUF4124 domain-containing protein [Aquabacterium lacunae]|jgi:Domain of unknown function (DUF4124)|uniref:DUF4124 domain-containing protein n=2 Tax=Aquabacterium lacunae TaxID=2528630 RepID=A0A4V2JFF8_9BURK|nr:DUF4124 domain-containing protein [Aquabacterium lacunae]
MLAGNGLAPLCMRHTTERSRCPLRDMPLLLACWWFAMFTGYASAQSSTVFKWSDAQGVVHYSERPPGHTVPNAQPVNVKVTPRAAPPSVKASGTDAFAEEFRRQASQAAQPPSAPSTKRPPVVSESHGKEHGTDASRCALARDILKGALRHTNGNPIDQHDIDTAQSDVRLFCKKR